MLSHDALGRCHGAAVTRPPDGAGRPSRHQRSTQKRAHPHEVVGRVHEAKHELDAALPPMMQFAEPADHFAPPEAFLDQLACLLTDRVPLVTRGPVVNGTPRFPGVKVLRDVGRAPARAHARDKRRGVVAFIRPEDPSPPAARASSAFPTRRRVHSRSQGRARRWRR